MCANGNISSNITYEESKRNILMKSVCSRKAFLKIIGQLIPLSNGVSTKSTRFQVRASNIFIFKLFKTLSRVRQQTIIYQHQVENVSFQPFKYISAWHVTINSRGHRVSSSKMKRTNPCCHFMPAPIEGLSSI